MDEYEGLGHAKRECKHHVVPIPKCRRSCCVDSQRQVKDSQSRMPKASGDANTAAAQAMRTRVPAGRISGVAEDPTGAVVAGAAVTVLNVATG